MNLVKLSWKNLMHKPLTTLLSVVLFALGVGMISLLLLLSKQLQDKFDKNLAGIDLVVGAKGSPLQLILCSMYHVDVPTGNITVEEALPLLSAEHPLIKTAIPLSLGDSHKGYRIVGTTPDILNLYEAQIDRGRIFKRTFEVVVGDAIANDLHLHLGDSFQSSHGFIQDEDLVHDHEHGFRVVGILKPSGSVIDQLVLTRTESIWDVHDHAPVFGGVSTAQDSAQVEDDHAHQGHNHDHADGQIDEGPSDVDYLAFLNQKEKEITSLLVQYKARNFRTLNFQRNVNENTDLQAASPAIEVNRLYGMMGIGIEALRTIAIIIIIVSAFSIFIALYNSLKDRKYELAVMRTLGAGKWKLFTMVILEGVLLAAIGMVLGLLLSHIGMEVFSDYLKEAYRYSFSGKMFLQTEYLLIAGALLLGFVSAVIPALRAYGTDISKTLRAG